MQWGTYYRVGSTKLTNSESRHQFVHPQLLAVISGVELSQTHDEMLRPRYFHAMLPICIELAARAQVRPSKLGRPSLNEVEV